MVCYLYLLYMHMTSVSEFILQTKLVGYIIEPLCFWLQVF